MDLTVIHYSIIGNYCPSNIKRDPSNGPYQVSCDRAIRYSGLGVRSVDPVGDFLDTPLKINMEPQSEGLEDDFPFQTGDFQVPC